MLFIPFSELKAKSGVFLNLIVQNGETIVITKHGRPVAQMTSFDELVLSERPWKRTLKRIRLKGESLSQTVLRMRGESH